MLLDYYIVHLQDPINGIFIIWFLLLQSLGVTNSSDRSLFKKKIKEMKAQVEKEKKAIAKENKNREKKEKKAVKKLFAASS